MSKLPRELENPFDNFFYDIGNLTLPFFKKTHHTPNILTTYSFGFGIFSVYSLYYGQINQFAIAYILSYLFDCLDGQMARQYNMFSKFGDFYDHFTDTIIGLMTWYVMYMRYKPNLKTLMTIVSIVLILFLLMNKHIGCQQKYFKNKENNYTESTDNLITLCPIETDLKWTRFFGVGTYILFIVGLVYYLEFLYKS